MKKSKTHEKGFKNIIIFIINIILVSPNIFIIGHLIIL